MTFTVTLKTFIWLDHLVSSSDFCCSYLTRNFGREKSYSWQLVNYLLPPPSSPFLLSMWSMYSNHQVSTILVVQAVLETMLLEMQYNIKTSVMSNNKYFAFIKCWVEKTSSLLIILIPVLPTQKQKKRKKAGKKKPSSEFLHILGGDPVWNSYCSWSLMACMVFSWSEILSLTIHRKRS